MSFFDDDSSDDDLGAHKSFWAHLDDLRTVMWRSAIVLCVALVICFPLTSRLVSILEYPLRHMDILEKEKPTIAFQIGETKMGPYKVAENEFHELTGGDAKHLLFHVGTVKIGDEQVVTLKLDPIENAAAGLLPVKLHNFSPSESFLIAFQVALYAALIISSPFWVYFIGQFILPALRIRERRVLYYWLGWGTALFLLGVLLTYFLLLPIALRASIEYSELLGFDGLDWKADDYISFSTRFLFGMGLGFQFPVLVLLLVKLGFLNHRHLAKYRRHVVVLSLVLGALLTTPEVITQVAMAVPLYILYEACIWIAWYWDWKKRRAAAASGITEI